MGREGRCLRRRFSPQSRGRVQDERLGQTLPPCPSVRCWLLPCAEVRCAVALAGTRQRGAGSTVSPSRCSRRCSVHAVPEVSPSLARPWLPGEAAAARRGEAWPPASPVTGGGGAGWAPAVPWSPPGRAAAASSLYGVLRPPGRGGHFPRTARGVPRVAPGRGEGSSRYGSCSRLPSPRQQLVASAGPSPRFSSRSPGGDPGGSFLCTLGKLALGRGEQMWRSRCKENRLGRKLTL